MSDPADPFVLAADAAAHALVLAEAAARTVLDLRADPPVGDLHIALFDAAPDVALPGSEDAAAVIEHMEGRLIADHGVGTGAVIESIGFSKLQITRLKAYECLRTGIDSYEAIVARRKFDGATRSYGSHLFAQIAPGGGSLPLVAAASGWRPHQDYLAAMVVAATLQCVLLEYGVLPRDGMISSDFVLSGGAWEYPAA